MNNGLLSTALKPDLQTPAGNMPSVELIQRLTKGHDILSRLDETDLLVLIRHSSVRALPKNRSLFRAGDEGRSVILILHGYVKLSSMAAGGREVVFEIAGPGTIFGELAVLNRDTRKADATTLTACRVLTINGAQFRNAIARSPEALLAAIRLLSERMAAVTEQGVDIVSLPAPVRLAKALLHLASLDSHSENGEVRVNLRLSQRELGAMTGMIRESINKYLKAWRAAGWVKLSGNSLSLLNTAALRNFVRDHEAQ